MDMFIARQPVFNSDLSVFGYELLYRKSNVNRFVDTDADEASSNVIINSFHVFGIDRMTGGGKAFINFTDNLLLQGVATLFPKETLVVEILETVTPSPEIVAACQDLKRLGYLLALDDFVDDPVYQPLVELADFIKVDFMALSPKDCQAMVRSKKNGRIRFLAEKIETQEAFLQAKAWGYSLFQGYFFSKPVIQPVGEIPPMKLNQLRLLELLNRPETEFAGISALVIRDVSLSYKLLRLINSPAFGLLATIDSVRHALVMLGLSELRKWLSLIIMRGLAEDKPAELIHQSLVRARMLEQLGKTLGWRTSEDDLFLLGLFSFLDVLLERPLADLLEGLVVPEKVKAALLRGEGLYGFLLSLMQSYEKGEWDEAFRLADLLGLERLKLIPAYKEALSWSESVLQEN